MEVFSEPAGLDQDHRPSHRAAGAVRAPIHRATAARPLRRATFSVGEGVKAGEAGETSGLESLRVYVVQRFGRSFARLFGPFSSGWGPFVPLQTRQGRPSVLNRSRRQWSWPDHRLPQRRDGVQCNSGLRGGDKRARVCVALRSPAGGRGAEPPAEPADKGR